MIQKIEEVLDRKENENLKQLLLICSDWRISIDNAKNGYTVDNGFCCIPQSKQNINTSKENKELTEIADTIAARIKKKLNINADVVRYYYNLYTKSAVGSLHVDENGDNFLSIVYSIDDEGYTIINDEKHYDKPRQAKIFNSNILHCGSPPIYNKFRFNLNIVLELKENYELKP